VRCAQQSRAGAERPLQQYHSPLEHLEQPVGLPGDGIHELVEGLRQCPSGIIEFARKLQSRGQARCVAPGDGRGCHTIIRKTCDIRAGHCRRTCRGRRANGTWTTAPGSREGGMTTPPRAYRKAAACSCSGSTSAIFETALLFVQPVRSRSGEQQGRIHCLVRCVSRVGTDC